MAPVLQLHLLAAARQRDEIPEQGPRRLVRGLQHPPRGPTQSGDGGRAANLQACECPLCGIPASPATPADAPMRRYATIDIDRIVQSREKSDHLTIVLPLSRHCLIAVELAASFVSSMSDRFQYSRDAPDNLQMLQDVCPLRYRTTRSVGFCNLARLPFSLRPRCVRVQDLVPVYVRVYFLFF